MKAKTIKISKAIVFCMIIASCNIKNNHKNIYQINKYVTLVHEQNKLSNQKDDFNRKEDDRLLNKVDNKKIKAFILEELKYLHAHLLLINKLKKKIIKEKKKLLYNKIDKKELSENLPKLDNRIISQYYCIKDRVLAINNLINKYSIYGIDIYDIIHSIQELKIDKEIKTHIIGLIKSKSHGLNIPQKINRNPKINKYPKNLFKNHFKGIFSYFKKINTQEKLMPLLELNEQIIRLNTNNQESFNEEILDQKKQSSSSQILIDNNIYKDILPEIYKGYYNKTLCTNKEEDKKKDNVQENHTNSLEGNEQNVNVTPSGDDNNSLKNYSKSVASKYEEKGKIKHNSLKGENHNIKVTSQFDNEWSENDLENNPFNISIEELENFNPFNLDKIYNYQNDGI